MRYYVGICLRREREGGRGCCTIWAQSICHVKGWMGNESWLHCAPGVINGVHSHFCLRFGDHAQCETRKCVSVRLQRRDKWLHVVKLLKQPGSGFPSNATLVWIFYWVTATYFGLITISAWRWS
jgi:hypothetical protein